MSTRKRQSQSGYDTLQPPSMTLDGLEVSLHTCPRALSRELSHVFPGVDLRSCLALPTSQKARMDLVGMGELVENEKDRLLNSFVNFASQLCEEIQQGGYWADYIDPCSGLPMGIHARYNVFPLEGLVTVNMKWPSPSSRMMCMSGYLSKAEAHCEKGEDMEMYTVSNKVYSEVDGMQLLLQYQVMNAGSCKVLLHPQWGSSVYPASLFSTAPPDVVMRLLDQKLSNEKKKLGVNGPKI